MKKLLIALATLALAAFALAACGDDESTTSSTAAETTSSAEDTGAAGGGGTVAVEAAPDGSFAFTESELTGTAGPNTIEFDNSSTTPHNVYVESEGGDVVAETDTISESSTTASADLEAGTYTYYCDIPGHREGGMEGTLTVE